jgi:putative ABC transport system substrate-binding protein
LFAFLVATMLASSLPAGAQPAMPVVGYLSAGSPEASAASLARFRDGLKEGGYVEGRNVAISFRWAEGRYELLPSLATELVALKVAVIVAIGTPAAQAAKRATQLIPIVFQSGTDVVQSGLVASLSRPGGNATGVTFNVVQLTPKRLEVLREIVPNIRTVAYLHRPGAVPSDAQLADVQAAAHGMGLALQIVDAGSAGDIEPAFVRLAERRPDGLLVAADWLFLVQGAQIAALAARHAIPAIYDFPAPVAAGGLVSYGPHRDDLYRSLGVYTGKILAGARPADLPVHQPTKFELVINLKTARALGLSIPPSILARADEVIE